MRVTNKVIERISRLKVGEDILVTLSKDGKPFLKQLFCTYPEKTIEVYTLLVDDKSVPHLSYERNGKNTFYSADALSFASGRTYCGVSLDGNLIVPLTFYNHYNELSKTPAAYRDCFDLEIEVVDKIKCISKFTGENEEFVKMFFEDLLKLRELGFYIGYYSRINHNNDIPSMMADESCIYRLSSNTNFGDERDIRKSVFEVIEGMNYGDVVEIMNKVYLSFMSWGKKIGLKDVGENAWKASYRVFLFTKGGVEKWSNLK